MKKLLAVCAAGLMACAPSVANAATYLFTAQFQQANPSNPDELFDDTYRLDGMLVTEDEDFGFATIRTAVSATGRFSTNFGLTGDITGVEGDITDFVDFGFAGGSLTFTIGDCDRFFTVDFDLIDGIGAPMFDDDGNPLFVGTGEQGEAFGPLTEFSLTPFEESAVPEPATWAMLIAGFGLTGAAMRRRRTRVAFA